MQRNGVELLRIRRESHSEQPLGGTAALSRPGSNGNPSCHSCAVLVCDAFPQSRGLLLMLRQVPQLSKHSGQSLLRPEWLWSFSKMPGPCFALLARFWTWRLLWKFIITFIPTSKPRFGLILYLHSHICLRFGVEYCVCL